MKSRPASLVITRKAADCPIVRLKNLAEILGPLKGRTYRQASRLANSLRAGTPIHNYDELDSARLLFLCPGRPGVRQVVTDLLQCRLHWKRKRVVVCGPGAASLDLARLADRGASVASMTALNDRHELRVFVEGDKPAVRAARRLVDAGGGRAVEVNRDGQPLCAVAGALTGWLLLSALDAATEALRGAGLPRRSSSPIIERMAELSVRTYLKGGRRAWRTPVSEDEQAAFFQQVKAAGRLDGELANTVFELARIAERRTGRPGDWLPAEHPGASRAGAG